MFGNEQIVPPEAGKKRYKAFCRNPRENPFAPNGRIGESIQTVDVDKDTPLKQVEDWARESAEEAGLTFLRVEEVT